MTEEQLHKQICEYIKLQYPNVIFNTDMSGIPLSMSQRIKAKKLRSSNGFPDIQILESNNDYFGLFLEVKKETPYKKNKELKKSTSTEKVNGVKVRYDHLQRQNDMHVKLRKRGYAASFVWTFEMAKGIIDEYLNN